MEEIRQYFEQVAPMGDSDWQFFSSKLHRQDLKKKSIITRVGEIEKSMSFISKGIVRYYIPREEDDLTLGFLFEKQFVTAFDSFITQLPSAYQIETLTDTSLWTISRDDLHEVYAQTQDGNLIGRRMAENMFLIKSRREIALLNKSAEERYLDLFSERPDVVKQIPLKYIASYIGVTPQALSRIRRRIT